MQSRMDKYNTKETQIRSRTQKNKELYEEVKNSNIEEFDVNSNISVIDTNAESINVDKLSRMLDRRYSDDVPKRRSIEVPDEPLIEYEEPIQITKEYDINTILEKAKQGKNIDYNKERLKKVRDAQYEILNNLDLELKKVEESKNNSRKQEEENLMNLINTITQLEIKNKEEEKKRENTSINLMDDLKDDYSEKTLPQSEIPDNYINDIQTIKINKEKIQRKEKEIKELIEREENLEEKTDKTEKTLSKLNIDLSNYDDFSDISKRDPVGLIIKILIFLVIIGLVIGAVFILNNVLDLGLFNN